jgi:hypothetical protein
MDCQLLGTATNSLIECSGIGLQLLWILILGTRANQEAAAAADNLPVQLTHAL